MTGAPVLGDRGTVVGMMTLRDIMKGRKAGQMQGKVKQFMSRNVVTAAADATIREVDQLLFKHAIGHLPIVRDGRLEGIVTRTDFLNHIRGERFLRDKALEKIGLSRPGPEDAAWAQDPSSSF